VTRVAASFVGCKVSQADGEEALAGLASAGLEPVTAGDAADVVVVHTCCVTAEAERKSRRMVRRAASAGKRVVVAGCAATLHPEQFTEEGVIVAPRPDWTAVAERLNESDGSMVTGRDEARVGEALRATPGARTRLVLKVQDGCAGVCAYCVVRLVRGRPRSVPLGEALAAARAGIEDGCGEVVLSGIDLGAWRGWDARLPELVAAVAELDGLRRVRLSSVEPRHVTPALVELLSHPRVARHLHVPLQSADDGVLRDMRRPYTWEGYLAAVGGLRTVPGGAMLSTDVIVGYPTEDEAAFGRTLAALESGLFGRAHVFAYSSRPGTAAAELPPLPATVVKERMRRALAAAEAAALAARRAALGRAAEVLVEERRDGVWRGYSSEYVRYALHGRASRGELVRAVAHEVIADGVLAGIEE
jgi:threonylcarbamoyladenosine tRNA methylthiotransferase MtaB